MLLGCKTTNKQIYTYLHIYTGSSYRDGLYTLFSESLSQLRNILTLTRTICAPSPVSDVHTLYAVHTLPNLTSTEKPVRYVCIMSTVPGGGDWLAVPCACSTSVISATQFFIWQGAAGMKRSLRFRGFPLYLSLVFILV